MKKFPALWTLAIGLWTSASPAADKINIAVPASYTQDTVVRRQPLTLTPTAPLPRSYGTNVFSRQPVSQYTDTNGLAIFTNVLWGYYRLDLPGNPGTSFNLVVGTNLSGTVNIVTLITNAATFPPNPATNYYTQAQADAIHAGLEAEIAAGSGGGGSGIATNNGLGTNTHLTGAVVIDQGTLFVGGYFDTPGLSIDNGEGGFQLGTVYAPLASNIFYASFVQKAIGGDVIATNRFTGDGSGLTNLNISHSIPMVTDYGAVGDGTTDDTSAFQRAVTNAIVGVPYGAAGLYRLGTVYWSNTCTLIGFGGALQLKSGGTLPMLDANGFIMRLHKLTMNGNSASIHGTAQAGTTNVGISSVSALVKPWGLNDTEIIDCNIFNVNGAGVSFFGAGPQNLIGRTNGFLFSDNICSNCIVGLNMVGDIPEYSRGVVNNRFTRNYCGVVGDCANYAVVGNTFVDNYEGLFINGGRAHISISDNIINHSTLAAFYFQNSAVDGTSYATVANNRVYGGGDIYLRDVRNFKFMGNDFTALNVVSYTAGTTNYFLNNHSTDATPPTFIGPGVIKYPNNWLLDGHTWDGQGYDLFDSRFVGNGGGLTNLDTALANLGTAGTYRSVTTDAKGRVTAGSNPTTFSGYAIADTVANLGAVLSDETPFGLAALQSPSTLVSNNFTPVMTFFNRVYFTNGATGNWGFNEGDSHFESNRMTGATFYSTNGVHYWTNGASFRIESASGDTNSGGFRAGGSFTTAASFEIYRTLAEALARTTAGRKISADASGLYLSRDLFLTLTASVDGTDAQTTSAAGIFLHRGAAAGTFTIQTNAAINAGSLPFPTLTIISTNPTTLAITDSSGTNYAMLMVSNLAATTTITATNGYLQQVRTVTADDTATLADDTILINGTTKTETLPTAVGNKGKEFTIKVIANSTATVATTSSQNIDGATTKALGAQYSSITVRSDGTQWWIVAEYGPNLSLASMMTAPPAVGTFAMLGFLGAGLVVRRRKLRRQLLLIEE